MKKKAPKTDAEHALLGEGARASTSDSDQSTGSQGISNTYNTLDIAEPGPLSPVVSPRMGGSLN